MADVLQKQTLSDHPGAPDLPAGYRGWHRATHPGPDIRYFGSNRPHVRHPAEVVPLPIAIKVAPEILAQYDGTYVLMPDLSLTVSVESDHLVVQATDQDKVSAYPESETLFFAKSVEAKLEFVRNWDGTIGCVLHQAGQQILGVKQ
ncbi:DUF3471 domain-containing protein [Asticcacaulis sp. SL142]|uniref:DUF3471 domain-containing protein n=1 Tax=Asticcacaulis sp. SL142 TaxID=2995155 RepID=UPI00226CA86B|nr:DUF3471 domain-containing protein [Asticcacaulis sp. SL142]WAC48243.1 DUF3471 domain-containing protein [Asticcacaulis sp. SL142]